jgi:glycosyltransferase involved in cell wall biosynthesis
MRATILLVVRNRAAQLRVALPTILAKGYADVEILVVDDGSTDETPDVLAAYGDALRVHRVERTGGYRRNPSHVLNLGHKLAKADVVIEQGGEVCHLNDCVAPLLAACEPGRIALARVYDGPPKAIPSLIEHYARNPYPADFELDKPRTEAYTWKVPLVHGVKLFCGTERPAPFVFLGAVHRQDFEAVGGYNLRIKDNNDGDFAARQLRRGTRFRFVGNALALHLSHGKS